jgi:pimeloyl-ACP methyl ester carboxylesterase
MEMDGARMRYLRAGSGPPLILLHGLLAYSFSWRFTLPALARYATVYALDQLGAGFSDRPKELDHSMHGTASRVLRFAANLGLPSFDLLGTSRGGAVAMCAAAEALRGHGPQVQRLVLVCPVNPYSRHGTRVAPFLASPAGGAGFRWAVKCMPFLFSYGHRRLYGSRSKIPPDSLRGYEAPLAIPGFFEHGLSIVKTWTADLEQLRQLLPKLREIPTLLVWGDKDAAVYVSSMEPLAQNFANVKRVVFRGIGHLPYEECPEEFNQAVIDFLSQPR